MRIGLVSEHASPLAAIRGADAGGQNVHVAALASELAAMGHEVVVSTRRDDPGLAPTVEAARSVLVHHLDAGPAAPISKDDLLPHVPAMTSSLEAFYREWRPDVVHAHFWMSGLAALPVARRLSIPIAQTFHALGTVKRRHQGLADSSPDPRRAEERRVATEVDRIVATCTDEVSELCAMGVAPSQSSVVPCGVEIGTFNPEVVPSWPPRSRRRLLCIGRLVPRKGVDDVIRALAMVPDAELMVAGGPDVADLDDDQEVARLRAEAVANGVADRVVFLGSVDRASVPALIRSADVVVSYPWYEPFGIVPLEAMACGVPAVVSDVGGMRDTVRHKATGLRVPARSPWQLANALKAVLDVPGVAHAMGAAGVERVRQRYSWSRVAAMTAEVYAEMSRSLVAGSVR